MSVLADFVLKNADHPENAASDALLAVLRRSPAATQGLVSFLARIGVSELGRPWIKREATGDEGERPDFAVRDAAGVERCIIESKFWAGLTDAQPLTYLRRLGSDKRNAVVFVCPPTRVESLWTELLHRCGVESVTLEPFEVGNGRGANTSLGPRLVVAPWQAFLQPTLGEAERQQDHEATADLKQIIGLAERLDRDDFVPLNAAAMSPAIPRAIQSYFSIVDRVIETLVRDGIANRATSKRSTSHNYYGRLIALEGIKFWFGLWWPAWSSDADTPFWLQLNDDGESWTKGLVVLDRLAVRGWKVFGEATDASLPLFPPYGRERDVVVAHLVGLVTEVRNKIARLTA